MTKNITDYAEEYLARGFAICLLGPGKKIPSYKEWNLKSLTPEDFADDDNIGILAGRLSRDLVCVDLDSEEALRLADEYLPHTDMVDGRPGKPRSHRWYRVTDIPPEFVSEASGGIGGPKMKHFKHAITKKGVLDFIGTGGQAAVPPSLHPSGERRVWYSEGEPAILPMAELWEAVIRLAEACGCMPDAKPEVQPKKRGVLSRTLRPLRWRFNTSPGRTGPPHSRPMPWGEISRTVASSGIPPSTRQEDAQQRRRGRARRSSLMQTSCGEGMPKSRPLPRACQRRLLPSLD
jgi:hypothetical protein